MSNHYYKTDTKDLHYAQKVVVNDRIWVWQPVLATRGIQPLLLCNQRMVMASSPKILRWFMENGTPSKEFELHLYDTGSTQHLDLGTSGGCACCELQQAFPRNLSRQRTEIFTDRPSGFWVLVAETLEKDVVELVAQSVGNED
jgi:hypothetical protein